ncbi:MAG TPA: hypothetical protein VJT49_20140 [Amycolatopsis sp.]|uniref:hypothetical protein n=1 Tax=Amycolatopsis sp. TaxID=37632 RepID=UPI002B460DAB|nr:hypothetical protein [Amycolatopsis sp.]HKS47375.1 hypothetical protein [Amycolatopsis sp.]
MAREKAPWHMPGGLEVDAAKLSDDILARRRAAARRLPPLACGYVDPWRSEPLEPAPRNLQASRRTWWHLKDLGLLSEDSERVLAESARGAAA